MNKKAIIVATLIVLNLLLFAFMQSAPAQSQPRESHEMIDTGVFLRSSAAPTLHIYEDKERGVVCYLAVQSISCVRKR